VSVGYFVRLSARPYSVNITVIDAHFTFGPEGLSFRRHSRFSFVCFYLHPECPVSQPTSLILRGRVGWTCIVMSASVRLISFEPTDEFHETWYRHQIVVGFYDVEASHDVGLWNSM
jgi:hypothetical protein